MIQTAGASVPQAPATDPISFQLQALVTEQVVATTHLVNLEASRVSIERQLKDGSGREVEMLRNKLSETVGAIEGEKAKIADLKARVADLQNTAPKLVNEVGVPALPPEFLLQPPRSGMFGMNKDEFLGVFILLLTMPIVIAVSRRLWMRTPKKAGPPAIETDRLQRLEQMVEAVAIEVERIGESQRFQSKLMAEKKSEPRRVNTPH